MIISDGFLALTWDMFEPFCLMLKTVPLDFSGLHRYQNTRTVDKTNSQANASRFKTRLHGLYNLKDALLLFISLQILIVQFSPVRFKTTRAVHFAPTNPFTYLSG
jgi:hypothetical protein